METTGKIFGVPAEVAEGTDAEKQAFLRRVVANGVARGETPPPTRQDAREGASRPGGGVPPLPSCVEPFLLPDGRTVYIRPLSTRDSVIISDRVPQWLRDDRLIRGSVPPSEQALYEQKLAVEALYRGRVWTVIRATYQGAEKGSPRVFEPADAGMLFDDPDWGGVVARITEISENLTQQGRKQSELQEAALLRFFECLQATLSTLLSQWSTGSPEACRSFLEDFAHSVSSVTQGVSSGQSNWGTALPALTSVLMPVGTDGNSEGP